MKLSNMGTTSQIKKNLNQLGSYPHLDVWLTKVLFLETARIQKSVLHVFHKFFPKIQTSPPPLHQRTQEPGSSHWSLPRPVRGWANAPSRSPSWTPLEPARSAVEVVAGRGRGPKDGPHKTSVGQFGGGKRRSAKTATGPFGLSPRP